VIGVCDSQHPDQKRSNKGVTGRRLDRDPRHFARQTAGVGASTEAMSLLCHKSSGTKAPVAGCDKARGEEEIQNNNV